MTTISDPREPMIEAEPVLLDGDKSKSRLAIAVGVGLTLFALLNATAAVYLYRGINDLRTLEARLEDLGKFEQRMSARLDTVNNGFQSRFEALDGRLQASFGEVNTNIARQVPEMTGDQDGGAAPRVVELSPSSEGTAAIASAAEPDQSAAEELPRVTRRKPAPVVAPSPSSNYQRIESPEGKVTYHKIN